MNILVTGGAGFLGRHLVSALRARGHDTFVIDPKADDVTGQSACGLVEYWPDGASMHRFDVIYHLGSPVGTVGVVWERGNVADRIVSASRAVADLAEYHDARLVNISTSEVYGRTGFSDETATCEVPARHSARLAYAVGKLAAEMDLHTSGAKVRTVRPFNVAGPGQKADTGFVLPRWCQAALRGSPIQVFGHGQLERAFCHVYDFTTALLRYAEPDVFDQAPAVLNIGNPRNRSSILDLAFMFAGLAGQQGLGVSVERIDGRDVFGPDWEEAAGLTKLPVIDQAQRWLEWTPELPLESVILDTLEYERRRSA